MEIQMVNDLIEDLEETKTKNDYLSFMLKTSITDGDIYNAQRYCNMLIEGQDLVKDIADIVNFYSIKN